MRAIDEKSARLIDLAVDGTMPQAQIKTKINDLEHQRGRIEAGLLNTTEELTVGTGVLRDALMTDPQRLYRDVADPVRHHLN